MNLQNLPREDKVVKRCFIPKLDRFIFADYNSIEYRILGFYCDVVCGDSSIVDEFKMGYDPHIRTAELIFPNVSITDEERQIAKTLNYSALYGGGAATVSKQLKINPSEAASFLTAFHAARPGIRLLHSKVTNGIQRRGYLQTIAGRRLRPDSEHKGLNYLLQGTAADVMRHALVKVDKELKPFRSHLVATTHDDLIIDATEPECFTIIPLLASWMQYPAISERIPIIVDIEHSEVSWGDKQPLSSLT